MEKKYGVLSRYASSNDEHAQQLAGRATEALVSDLKVIGSGIGQMQQNA